MNAKHYDLTLIRAERQSAIRHRRAQRVIAFLQMNYLFAWCGMAVFASYAIGMMMRGMV